MSRFVDDGIAALATLTAVGISFTILRMLLHRKRNKTILSSPVVARSGHCWSSEPYMNRGYSCNMCEGKLTGGFECALCRLKVDEPTCLHLASETIPCKVNAISSTSRILKHHWVFGNIEPEDLCAVCEEPCGEDLGLSDFWCAWCCRAVHTDCKRELGEECDRGAIARSVIPPNCVALRKAGSRNQRQMVIESITIPEDVDDFRPLIIVVNPKSGSGAGTTVAKAFKSALHPIQIVDVTKCNMKATLRWLDEFPEVKARMLIAGGDGTISLVLDDVDQLQNRPAVAVLPLGTGNDLSRVLGWGNESDGRIEVKEMMQLVQCAEEQPLDRWTVSIEPMRRSLGLRQPARTLSMTNYVSIGVDACVTFGMQTTRSTLPRALSSRLLNKLLFFTYGTKDLFSRACRGLEKRITLELDGQVIDLPEIEGIVFLNIQCWGAGVKVWKEKENDQLPQKVDDGLFEVFAVRSSFHIAKLQVGLSNPIRIGQASKAVLTVKTGPLPMQSDGEAWMQKRATVTISHKGTSVLLKSIPLPTAPSTPGTESD